MAAMVAISVLLASLAVSSVAASAPSVIVTATSPGIDYAPANSWATVDAPGSAGSPQFLLSNADQGVVTFTFLHASTFFEFWGYQRSDGGLYSISVDGGSTNQVDVYNQTSTGNDPPVLLYSANGLSNQAHTVKITNLLDNRVGHYGQMNVDHFVIAAPSVVQPTFPAGSFLSESTLEFSYHTTLSLGADSTANGGSGATVKVLLDTGATGAWVIWSGCTESVCTTGHNVYHESQQHFANTSIHESLVYGNGGPANTISMWRVNDTVTFGSVSIPETPFGAADSIPSGGEGLDGNFGMARAYCGGHQCGNYPGFVETMYLSGLIKAPALSFYQLAPGDVVASGVQSTVAIGGVDRNKYIGSMDWFPLTDDSMWIIPDGNRVVTPGAGKAPVDATSMFTHTSVTLDTGDPGLLGLPTNDWLTLVSIVGAKGPDSNGNYLFPCDSTMTLNFHGTQNRDYTFTLVDPTTANGGFCSPAANDAGQTTNWIMGAPFFDHYYTVWYFGELGVGSTIGFGQKNLDASATQSSPVVGYA